MNVCIDIMKLQGPRYRYQFTDAALMNSCKLEWKKRIFMTNFNKESVRLMGVSMHPLPKLTCTQSIEDTLYSLLKIAVDCFIGTIHK